MSSSGNEKIELKEIIGIDQIMNDHELILIYRDEIDQDATENLLSLAEVKMLTDNKQKKLKRKLFNILVECLQNVVKHADAGHIEKYRKSSIFVLGKTDEKYFIICGNVIANKHIEELTQKIEKVNPLNTNQLKSYYGKIISENEYSEKGGAGLGLIEMCRKSGNPIKYNFQELDSEYSYFTIKIIVNE